MENLYPNRFFMMVPLEKYRLVYSGFKYGQRLHFCVNKLLMQLYKLLHLPPGIVLHLLTAITYSQSIEPAKSSHIK